MSTPTNPTPVDPTRYVAPGGRMDAWSAAVVRWLTAHGISLYGSRVLVVRGRKSGEPRSNARAAGVAELQLGKRAEAVELVELPADQRVPVLRVYLTRWGWEVGRFVEGLSKKSTDAEIAAVAPGMPVFHVRTAA